MGCALGFRRGRATQGGLGWDRLVEVERCKAGRVYEVAGHGKTGKRRVRYLGLNFLFVFSSFI